MTSSLRPAILMTGAGGYIGAPTMRALTASGYHVHVMGRRDPNIAGTTFHHVDLLRESDLRSLIEGMRVTSLLHLAWSVTPGKFWTDLANCDWVAASLRLFRAFIEAGGQRIVGVGSCAEYDWSGSSRMTEDISPICPGTLYGKAKASLWNLLEATGKQEGLSVAWARLFFLYGPHEPRGKLVSDAINTLLAGQRFATTPGLQKRDFIHVEDAGAALAALVLSSVTGPVNIGSGHSIMVRELLDQLAEAAQVGDLIDFGARTLAKGEPMDLVANTARLREEVGFTPRLSLTEGVVRTVEWWRNQALTRMEEK